MISYVWNAKEEDIYKEDICNVIKSFLIKFKKESMDVEIQFDSDDVIKMLNNSYRDIDHSTDVLSFPNFSPEELKNLKSGMLGSIIIAYPTAKIQAKEYGHSLRRELCFLCAHGMLHLFGYNHKTPETEEEMTKMANEILSILQINRTGG